MTTDAMAIATIRLSGMLRAVEWRQHGTSAEGVSRVRLLDEALAHGSQSRSCRATCGTQGTVRTESAQAGTEAKVRAEIRRPRPCRRLTIGLLSVSGRDVVADEVFVHQATPDDAGNCEGKAIRVAQAVTVVKPERLLVQIPE